MKKLGKTSTAQTFKEEETMKELKCKDCGATFVVDDGEQAWFAEKGFELPKRCKPCRSRRKNERLAKIANTSSDSLI